MKQLPQLLTCLIVTMLLTAGCSTFFKRTPAQIAALPKHYIMTLHGVRGNEASYGQFHELVKMHLERIDPSYEVIPLNLTYQTAQADFTPSKAAAEINMKLDKLIPVLNPQDKISVVAYSMGGQVGVAWYYDSLKDPNHSKYPMQTSNFISLGAAFWGAEEAALIANDANAMVKRVMKSVVTELNAQSQELTKEYVGSYAAVKLAVGQKWINERYLFPQIDKMKSLTDIKNFYDNKKIRDYYSPDLLAILDRKAETKALRDSTLKSLAKVSFSELQSLAIAGDSVTNLRSAMISKISASGSVKLPTKWLSISTLVQCFETDLGAQTPGCDDFQNKAFGGVNGNFAKFSFGLKRRETDNAVITPSSVAQFYYAFDANPNYAVGELTPRTNFNLSLDPADHNVLFAETLHATLVTEGIYDKAFGILGRLGKSWERLADDVVIVHKTKCMTAENCDHPVYKYELQALADCDVANSKCADTNLIQQFLNSHSNKMSTEAAQSVLKSQLHGFTLELNLRVPSNYDISKIDATNVFDSIPMDFDKSFSAADRQLKTDVNSPYKIQIGRKFEMASILVNKVSYSNQKNLKINFTGIISPNNSNFNSPDLQKGVSLKFGVNLPGLKPRQVEAIVSPYHSTFVDLVMAK